MINSNSTEKKIRLLLVDDHKILRDGLKQAIALEKDMALVGEADNGREALVIAGETQPDVIIMDVSMPDLNGIEASRQIIKNHPDQKIIALSMHDDKRYVMGMFKAGVSGYLLKTNAFEHLAEAVRQVAAGHSYISSNVAGTLIRSALDHEGAPDEAEELSSREIEILQLIAEGKNTEYMADILHISKRTVENHRRNLRKKLKLDTTAELTRYAIKKGIISL
ncbi:MAG: response regulator transcription factor [Desulfobacterales bacterium]|nr:response regulator transcription factor [Desulfobacterales bacterium]